MDSGGGIVHGEGKKEERKKETPYSFSQDCKLNFDNCPTDEEFESFQLSD